MIDAVSQSPLEDVGAGFPAVVTAAPHVRTRRWGLAAAVWFGLVGIAAAGLWGGYREARTLRYELKVLRDTAEAAAAPGELVVVDDRLLGWALGRGGGGLMKPNLLVVSAGAPPSSLLEHLSANRREMVLVARPDDPLVRALDAAGFSVAQEVGWVPWDPGERGRGLLGRSRVRIFFVVAPKTGAGGKGGAAVSSNREK
jgi:hypothetical protein